MISAQVIQNKLSNLKQFLNYSKNYLIKNNPAQSISQQFIMGIKNTLTHNKKLKIAKYRVNHLSYRLYQMETLIEQGNPSNLSSGKALNIIR